MYDPDDLRRWSRPEGVLEPDEQDRVGEWLELFAMQLQVIEAGPTPSIAHRFAARRAAMLIWRFDRMTSTSKETRARPANGALARSADFEEFEIRHRLNNLALDELDSARTFARVAGGAVEVNVIPFKAKRKRTG